MLGLPGNLSLGGLIPLNKIPDPIDVHVGSRVRLRRMLIGMTQVKLGQHVGLTFQQIQKYEKGTNRIGASRLHDLSLVLDVPVQYFFDEAPLESRELAMPGIVEQESVDRISDFLGSREGLELNRAFVKIRDTEVRRTLVDLVRAFAGNVQKP